VRLLRDLLLTGLALLVLLACLEESLRLLDIRFSTVFVEVDPVLGYVLRPNTKGWEDENYYTTNSDGMRDREHTVARPPNTLRIAIVGDSMTEAIQVPFDKTYSSVFEKSLSECLGSDGPKIEVLNFGVVGYNLAQDYLALREKIFKYQPQVIVAALGDNAPLENSRKLDPTFTRPRPYFVFQDGKLQLDSPPKGYDSRSARVHDEITAFTNQFEIAKLFKQAFSQLSADVHHLIVDTKAKLGDDVKTKQLPKPELVCYLPPSNTETVNAWNVTEASLEKIAETTREHGAVFQVFLVGMSGQLLPGQDQREAFARSLGVARLDYLDTRLEHWSAQHGVTLFDAVPQLQEAADHDHLYLRGDNGMGHFNVPGNYYLGKVLARRYCEFLHSSAAGRTLLESTGGSRFLQASTDLTGVIKDDQP
jgi:hypothetical protein